MTLLYDYWQELVYLTAYVIIIVRIEALFQQMRLHTWPPRWLPRLCILLGSTWRTLEILRDVPVSSGTALFAVGVALWLTLDRPGVLKQ